MNRSTVPITILEDLTIIVTTSRTLFDAFLLILEARMTNDLQERKKVIFRNGTTMNLDWKEYAIVRNIVCNDCVVEQLGELFLVQEGKMRIVESPSLVGVVNERLVVIYMTECENKIILEAKGVDIDPRQAEYQ